MALKPYRISKVEAAHGNLHSVIPKLVNETSLDSAARQLGISSATVCRWLQNNGYERVTQYVRKEKKSS
jgi:hypothetical protein